MRVLRSEQLALSQQLDVAVDEPTAVVAVSAVEGLVVLGTDNAETCSDEMCFVSRGDISAN